MSKKKPKQETPPNLRTAIGSINYDANSKTFDTQVTGDATREQAQTGLESAYAGQAQNYNKFQQDPTSDRYFTDFFMPTMERELSARQSQFDANLGRRMASTFGALTAQKQAQNDAIFRAGIPRQYDNELLQRLGLLGENVKTAQNIRYNPYQVLQGLYNQGGSAPIYDNAMNRAVERDKLAAEKQAAMFQAVMGVVGDVAGAAIPTGGAAAKVATKAKKKP